MILNRGEAIIPVVAREEPRSWGITNHFSHRLVARGMKPAERAVLLPFYLITAAKRAWRAINFAARGKIGLQADTDFLQTLLEFLGVVALLEQHPALPAQEVDSSQ